MTMFRDTLLDLIDKKFNCQIILKDLEWGLLQDRNDEILDERPVGSEAVSSGKLGQEIEQIQEEIKEIEVRICELAEKILRTPLCLVPIPNSYRPFLQRLQKARSILGELEEVESEASASIADGAQTEVERAIELLKSDRESCRLDEALAWLFQATVSEKCGDYEGAQAYAQRAFRNFPEGDEPYRLVAQLVQGNIYSNSSTGRIFEGDNACSNALRRLERLQQSEIVDGNEHKAELYRVLKDQLQQKLRKSRTWKVQVPL